LSESKIGVEKSVVGKIAQATTYEQSGEGLYDRNKFSDGHFKKA
jgi:hypothetical protein